MNMHDIAHKWANDIYGNRSEIKAGNVFARRDERTIYSYGRHFPIARLTGNPIVACLFTAREYSVSTAKHKSRAWSACYHLKPLTVADVTSTGPGNVEAMAANIAELMKKHARARTSANYIAGQIAGLVADAERYCRAFGIKPSTLSKVTRATLKHAKAGTWKECTAEVAKAREADERARVKTEAVRRAKAEAEAMEGREKWLAGDTSAHYYRASYDEPARLRVMGDRVETSQGARVTCKAAVALFRLAERQRAKGQAYTIPPEKPVDVNGYPLNQITATGDVVIGCHRLEFDEMARVAPLALAALV